MAVKFGSTLSLEIWPLLEKGVGRGAKIRSISRSVFRLFCRYSHHMGADIYWSGRNFVCGTVHSRSLTVGLSHAEFGPDPGSGVDTGVPKLENLVNIALLAILRRLPRMGDIVYRWSWNLACNRIYNGFTLREWWYSHAARVTAAQRCLRFLVSQSIIQNKFSSMYRKRISGSLLK